MKEGLNKWRGIHGHALEKLDIVKMAIIPKLIYRFKAISIKILPAFWDNLHAYSKIHKEMPGTQNS